MYFITCVCVYTLIFLFIGRRSFPLSILYSLFISPHDITFKARKSLPSFLSRLHGCVPSSFFFSYLFLLIFILSSCLSLLVIPYSLPSLLRSFNPCFIVLRSFPFCFFFLSFLIPFVFSFHHSFLPSFLPFLPCLRFCECAFFPSVSI